MQAVVVVVLHIATELMTEIREGGKRSAVNQFGFQRVKERFHVGVFIRRTTTRHALLDAADHEALAKRCPETLAAAIAMKDQGTGRLTATPSTA